MTRAPDFAAITAAGNARGGTPVDQALAEVAEYLRVKHLHVTLALSAISTGLDQISRGRSQEGLRVARHGLDYLRERVEEARHG